jgi:predicted RNA-binding protein with PUA-like domain
VAKQFWLMKSEPEEFSIDDLERKRVEPWSGVRSMFARFHMRQMQIGDGVLFYHSSCDPPGVAGLAQVARIAVVDETQFDPASKYFDDTSTREKPKWDCVEVDFVEKLANFVPLERLRGDAALAGMVLFKQGRLSVQPVSEAQYEHIVALAQTAWEPPPKPPKPKKPKKPKPKRRAAKPKARTKRKAKR